MDRSVSVDTEVCAVHNSKSINVYLLDSCKYSDVQRLKTITLPSPDIDNLLVFQSMESRMVGARLQPVIRKS